MKKLIAAALSSTALLAAPAIFAQTAGSGENTGGDGGLNQPGGTPPLTPSQVETSDGAVHIPPPLDRSGNAKHVSEKGRTGPTGDHSHSSTGQTGSNDGSSGSGAGGGNAGDSGSGEGDSAGSGAGTGR